MSRLAILVALGLLVAFAVLRGASATVDSARFCQRATGAPPKQGPPRGEWVERIETEACFWHTTHHEIEYALGGQTP